MVCNVAGHVHGYLLGECYMQVSAADIFDSPGLKVLSQLGAGGLQTFCGFAERDVTLFVALRDALQVVCIFSPHAHCENRVTRLEQHQCEMPASETWVTVQTLGGQKKLQVAPPHFRALAAVS